MTSTHRAVVTTNGDRQILITREFDAPRHLVFRAWTEPDLIARWWAGDRGTVTSIEADARTGGRWRYVMTADAGFEVAFHGEYREVVPDERLVYTEVYEAMPESTAVTTVTFTADDDRTTVTVVVEHATREARDTHIGYGMEGGLQEALTHLEQVARSLR